MVGKTLIVYTTRTGVNAQAASAISEILRLNYNTDTTVVDLKADSPDIALYENVIVGSGLKGNRVYKETIDFLGKDFGPKKVALYFSCVEPAKASDSKVVEDYKKQALSKNPALAPVDVGLFAGCFEPGGKAMIDECNIINVKAWTTKLAPMLN